MNVALVNLKANMRMNVSINFHYGWMIFSIHLMYGLKNYIYMFLINGTSIKIIDECLILS
jgi:hypothetical protein